MVLPAPLGVEGLWLAADTRFCGIGELSKPFLVEAPCSEFFGTRQVTFNYSGNNNGYPRGIQEKFCGNFVAGGWLGEDSQRREGGVWALRLDLQTCPVMLSNPAGSTNDLQYIDLLGRKDAPMKNLITTASAVQRCSMLRVFVPFLSMLGLLTLIPMVFPTSLAQAEPTRPAVSKSGQDGAGAFASGKFRNVFVEQGHEPEEVQARIAAAYRQLFHGNPQTEAIYFETGKNANGPLAYVTDWASRDVRTEGMSYGMMIAVQLDHKHDFDALWNWAMTFMHISDPRHPSYGYFSWSCRTDGTPNEETPAPDGEEYFVMALYFAAARWGNGEGIYDYKREADTLLTAMRHRAVISGPTKFGPRTVGNEVDETYKMIRFVPGIDRGNFSDPSYHLPAFYEIWARVGPPEDREFWAQAAQVSRAYFVKATNPETGLAPDYANFDGTPKRMGKYPTDLFGYDAWRTASNWSVDWAWWGKAPQEHVLSDRIQTFFATQGIDKFVDKYTLDGKPMSDHHSTGLVAANAVASLAATQPRAKEFVEALWKTPIPAGEQRYYDGLLYLMSLMHLGGEYRIWMPK